MLQSDVIREEFVQHNAPTQFFHDIDDDFMYDETYKAIKLYDGEWHNYKWFKNTICDIKRIFGPSIRQAMFSIMEGPKCIAPHKNEDNSDTNVRYHIGILVHPEETAYLLVGRKKLFWKEDKWFTFDTKKTHRVYKFTSYTRVVLIIDYEPSQHKHIEPEEP